MDKKKRRVRYDHPDTKTASDARSDAQRIAFGPIVFQAAQAMRKLGILEALYHKGDQGLTLADVARSLSLPEYGVRVLLETGLSSGMVRLAKNRYSLTKTGFFLLKDELTTVNFNFVADVCYDGMRYLADSVTAEKPKGLQVFGQWDTIYEGLSQLPEPAQSSWFAFDHFYSNGAFPEVFDRVFDRPVARLLDIGGNTGRWALHCLQRDPHVEITLLDLPGQLDRAKRDIEKAGLSHRVKYHPANVLHAKVPWPAGFDVVWMSQFLDCFSPEQIIRLLEQARRALNAKGSIYILETYWDRQYHEAAAFSLHNTSLYFTCLANGTSKMYHSDEVKKCVAQAGLRVVRQIDDIGLGHTLLECQPQHRGS
jgi:ubiquinone/menaquinone biosynthesis C-methylase UbiE